MEDKEKKITENETLKSIKQQVSDLQNKGYEALGMIYPDPPESNIPSSTGITETDMPSPATSSDSKGLWGECFLTENNGIGYTSDVDAAFLKIAKNVSPQGVHREMCNFTPQKDLPNDNPLFERTIIPIEYPNVGSPGKGYIPWGMDNKLPNFIYQTSRSLPYTARSLQFLRDQIVGLGVEFMYRWSRYAGGRVTTQEIPYKDAGVLIRGRIMELEEIRKQANESSGGESSVINMMNLDSKGKLKPGTIEYEIDKLQRDYQTWDQVNAEIKEFEENNQLMKHEMSCMEDFVPMEIYFPLLGLSRGKPGEDWEPKIVSLRHISCCAARLEEMDEDRKINYVYYSDKWRTTLGLSTLLPQSTEIVSYPALPEVGTMEALRDIVTRKKKVGVRSRPTWFCLPRRMPCMNSLYYPVPYWWSIYSSEVYNYAATIIADRAAARMNSTMWGKIIMVNHEYLTRLWAANNCTTPEKKKEFRKKLKQNIDDFLKNRKNNGSTAMFESVLSPDGSTIWDSIKIIDVPINTANVTANKTELAEISNVIFLAIGIHSVLMGNEISASSSTGGTVQRELDLLTQKHLSPMQKDYLDLLNFIRDWNKWDPEHGIFRSKQMSLTTLDASKTGTTTVNNEGEKVK